MEDALGEETTIPTNLRLLIVIEELARAGVPLTATELNRTLCLPKPTIHRLFTTLEDEGFIQRDMDGRGYSPGLRLRQMSAGILSSLRIRTARTAILTELAEEIGETCNISLPDRNDMLYIDRVETKWPLRIQLPIGTHVPFYCTASGKLYLSTLKSAHLKSYLQATDLKINTPNTIQSSEGLLEAIEDIKKRGFSTDNEEFMQGMIAVAVPIKDAQGRLVSTLSIHAPSQRLKLEMAILHVPRLNQAAEALSGLIREKDTTPESPFS